jgi:hypothetical protein
MAVQATSGKAITLLVSGVVGIGMITALTLPGRQTIGLTKAAGKAGSGLLGTAIRG